MVHESGLEAEGSSSRAIGAESILQSIRHPLHQSFDTSEGASLVVRPVEGELSPLAHTPQAELPQTTIDQQCGLIPSAHREVPDSHQEPAASETGATPTAPAVVLTDPSLYVEGIEEGDPVLPPGQQEMPLAPPSSLDLPTLSSEPVPRLVTVDAMVRTEPHAARDITQPPGSNESGGSRTPPEEREAELPTDLSGSGEGKDPPGDDIVGFDGEDPEEDAQRLREAVEGFADTAYPLRSVQASRQWERILTEEDMPNELPDNIAFTSTLDKKYQHIAIELQGQQGVEPTHDEIIGRLVAKGITREQERVVRELGERVLLDAEVLDALPDYRESVEDIVARPTLGTVLNTLSPLEAKILSLRLGLADGTVYTLSDIHSIYGISKSRVREIVSNAMRKLRQPETTALLLDFAGESDNGKDQPTCVYQKVTSGDSVFQDIPEVPIYDPEDQRLYAVRLEEASENAAKAWLEEKTKRLNGLSLNQLQRELSIVSRQIKVASDTHQRVLERPLHPHSQATRYATVMAIEIRMQALQAYVVALQDRVVWQHIKLTRNSR